MPGRTISEKILSRASGRDARAGDLVVCSVDCAMGTDGSAPMAIDYFEQMGGSRVFDPARIVFVIDHYTACPGSKTADLQDRMRVFAGRHGIVVYDVGEGICHQLMVENGRTRSGGLLVGADSHSVTGGALNAFATGIGSSDLAATMMCGRIWLKVPTTIKVVLEGKIAPRVFPKDIVLALAGLLGADGAAYQALEFDGPAAADLDVEDRMVLSNMSVEMGAKAGIFRADQHAIDYLASGLADGAGRNVGPGASGRSPLGGPAIATVESPVAPGVHLVITPASKQVETILRNDGTLDALAAMGATITPPGCGPCCGTSGPIPADGANVISTANRNVKARMGNATASIYLASPAACAAAAVTGRITDPRDVAEGPR